MMRMSVLSLCLLASAACANVETSKRPEARPDAITAQDDSTEAQPEKKRGFLGLSLRPFLRSPDAARAGRQKQKLRRQGAVCGDIAIQGDAIGQIRGRIQGCGIESAVRVQSVSGVSLSTASVMDCQTASALKTWIDNSAKPAMRRTGGGLSQIRVAAHYACRTRNNQKGRRISEHGKGRAIDISGFTLADGSQITVLDGWRNRRQGKALKLMHKAACGPFGTVLGPNANKFHRDHFHFDTARYRSGSYCK